MMLYLISCNERQSSSTLSNLWVVVILHFLMVNNYLNFFFVFLKWNNDLNILIKKMTWLFTFCSKIEVAYQEAVALKRQEELIREEEASWLAETELKAKKASDKEKKSKKKQVLSLHMFMVFDYTVKISDIFFIYNLLEHLFN